MLSDFHFLRPLWLIALILIPVVCILLYRHKKSAKQWSNLIDKTLLNHLIKADAQRISPLPIILIAMAGVIAVLALAGPSWQKLPQPQLVSQQPLVLLIDLSPSMTVQDIKPSRLIKMRFKLIDLLKARKEGLTAMIAYAGDAHVLAPLSEDTETLISLVPTLSPQVMPVSGSNTEEAVALAMSLLQVQGYKQGNLILFSDGMTALAAKNVSKQLQGSGYQLSILGIGTEAGAPILLANKEFAKDESGNIVLAKLDTNLLQKVASESQGIYQTISLSNDDISALLARQVNVDNQYRAIENTDAQADSWLDAGQWLLLFLLPLTLMAFRRGWILQVAAVSVLIMPYLSPSNAYAFEWQDLWKTNNQQAVIALEEKDYEKAAQKFSDESWKGVAEYKAGNFEQSAQRFAAQKNADGYYNQGNALAHSGKLKEAFSAYEKALLLQPDMEDAKANKQLLEQLLKQQNQQQDSAQNDESQNNEQQQQQQQQQQRGQKNQQSNSQDQSTGDNSQENSESKTQENQQQSAKDSTDQRSSADKETGSSSENKPEESSLKAQAEEDLEHFKDERQKQEQQAINQLKDEPASQNTGKKVETAPVVQHLSEKAVEQQQLENWLGQLPEDASRLVRNKFNYEYQKKRQAYINGQWQPPKEKRW